MREFSIIDFTDGWLTDWGKSGGRFKEWVRGMELDAISNGWWHSISREPGSWWRRIKHVVSWIPYLWDDYDFDQVYLWKIMREKLRRMREDHEESQFIADWKRVADEIRVAENILTRLIEDKYANEDWERHHKQYGEPFPDFLREELPDGSVMHHPRPDPDGRCGADIKRITDREWSRKKADAKFLGQYMAKHWWRWWS
jgi:hypothetical protein